MLTCWRFRCQGRLVVGIGKCFEYEDSWSLLFPNTFQLLQELGEGCEVLASDICLKGAQSVLLPFWLVSSREAHISSLHCWDRMGPSLLGRGPTAPRGHEWEEPWLRSRGVLGSHPWFAIASLDKTPLPLRSLFLSVKMG